MRSASLPILVLCGLLGGACTPPAAATPARPTAPVVAPLPEAWSAWAPLVGRWVGDGDGSPGQGGGGFSLVPSLEGHVLVRESHADYPAQGGRPAAHHEDLMVVYRDGDATRATYFDNEDHVIRYDVTIDGSSAVFVSDASSPGPRFRLTYTWPAPGELTIAFEIAPPDAPDQFQPYLTATAHRAD